LPTSVRVIEPVDYKCGPGSIDKTRTAYDIWDESPIGILLKYKHRSISNSNKYVMRTHTA
jgi:hypothetical protein